MSFDPQLEFKFIELVGKHELLYNPSHREYRISESRKAAWAVIAGQVNKTVDECYKTWHDLLRFHSRVTQQLKQNGGAANSFLNKQKQYEAMAFLNKNRIQSLPSTNRTPEIVISDDDEKKEDYPMLALEPHEHVILPDITKEDLKIFHEESSMSNASEEPELTTSATFQTIAFPVKVKNCIGNMPKSTHIRTTRRKIEKRNKPTRKSISSAFSIAKSKIIKHAVITTPETCCRYMGSLGTKVDCIDIPKCVRYKLEKQVADIVYIVLSRYNKNTCK